MKTESGFTLIELMVSLALSSIIFASAYQVISNLVHYQSRASLRAQVERDEIQLGRLFGELVEKGLLQQDLPDPGSRKALFEGRPDSLRILSRAYSRNFDRPGYRSFRLFLRDGEIRVAHSREQTREDPSTVIETTTDIPADDLGFEYFDGQDWQSRWSDPRRLPRFIRMRVTTGTGRSLIITRETAVR